MWGWIYERNQAFREIARAVKPSESILVIDICARKGLRPPQLTAFLTSAPILASSATVNSFSAKATGHTCRRRGLPCR